MSVSQNDTEIATPAAPHEGNISTEHAYNTIVHVPIEGKYSVSDALVKFVDPYLNGCGRVDLFSLQVIFKCKAASASIQVGFSEVGSSAPISVVSMKENGLSHTANAMTFGAKIDVHLVPEDTLSRQLRPVSSMLPTPKLHVSISENVEAVLVFHLKVHGVRMVYGAALKA